MDDCQICSTDRVSVYDALTDYGMKLSELYPSRYFKASDFESGPRTLTIKSVVREEIGEERKPKPCIYFHDEEKCLVPNKTTSFAIGDQHGDDTKEWIGKPITLGRVRTSYKGKPCWGIAVIEEEQAAADDDGDLSQDLEERF